MEIQFLDIINILTPFAGGVVGWVMGRKKQKNDFLTDLQSSIDLLSAKNKQLLEEVITLRGENSQLRIEFEKLRRKFEAAETVAEKIKADETG